MQLEKGNRGGTCIIYRSDQNLTAAKMATGRTAAMVLSGQLCFTGPREQTGIGPLPAALPPVLVPWEQPQNSTGDDDEPNRRCKRADSLGTVAVTYLGMLFLFSEPALKWGWVSNVGFY